MQFKGDYGVSWFAAWCCCKSEVHILHAQRAAPDNIETGRAEKGDNLLRIDVAMPLMKVREKTSLLFQSAEINDEQSAAGFQHPAHFAGSLFTQLARQVMKHQ